MTSVHSTEVWLLGTPICRGIAIGSPFLLAPRDEAVVESSIAEGDVEAEVARYRKAIEGALQELRALQSRLHKEQIFDGAAILDAHVQMLQDPLLTVHVEAQIRNLNKNSEFLLKQVITECQKKFQTLEDPFFQERFKDLQGLGRRIMGHLNACNSLCLNEIPAGSIVIADDLTACDSAEANGIYVSAFVTRSGGATSHAAIVAKAKGIPYVSSVDIDSICRDAKTALLPMSIIVDGRTGEIVINPKEETLQKYRTLHSQLQHHMQKLKETGKLQAETYDGYLINLSANVEMVSEVELIHQFGGGGVGLLRTESAFLSREDFPSEEEQFEMYRQFVVKMDGLPIAIRAFDLGGDKYLKNHPASYECNPFLGCRAIRFLLRNPKIFKSQLRAILRASAHGKVSVMFPLVSALSELIEAKYLLNEAKEELKAEGFPVAEEMLIGCMIEVPSAAVIADLLAKECDFLSIGTNDLVQYALAVDRSNHVLSALYAPTHPSVIRLIRLIVNEANHHGIPVTVCGEVAADPRFTPLLLGLGVHELSVTPRHIPIIKNAIRNTSIVLASKLADKALELSSAEEIEELLMKEYRRNVPEDCIYNC